MIAATKANMVSLVVSYRNDAEGPSTPGSRSTLGMDETDDVAAAVEYAIAHGARRIVLIGWSMGANIALKLMAESPDKGSIVGVFAVSPVLDWTETLRSNCRRVGLPAFTGSIAARILSSGVGAKILRLHHAIRLNKLNWLERAGELNRPVLLTHGSRDSSVPVSVSRQLARQANALVTLIEFQSDHTLEWNAHPERWQSAVLGRIIGLGSSANPRLSDSQER